MKYVEQFNDKNVVKYVKLQLILNIWKKALISKILLNCIDINRTLNKGWK